MTDFLTTISPSLELDEVAKNYALHLTRDELLIFIIALLEERDEPSFIEDVSAELEDLLDDSPYEIPPPEEDDGYFLQY